MAKKGRKYTITDNTTISKFYDGYATKYADTITMYGQSNSINTGKGNDIIKIFPKKKGNGRDLTGEGGAGKDTITIYYKKTYQCEAYGGAGNDKLTINAGSSNRAYGGANDDTIYIKGGTSNYAYGDAGKDKINIQGGSNH